MRTALYYVEGKLLGQSTVRPESRSFAWFCPECCDLWARVVVLGAIESEVITCACERHENRQTYTGGQPPGALVPAGYACAEDAWAGSPLLFRNLPRAVLRREILLYLKERNNAPK